MVDRLSYRLVSPSGSPVTGTVERMVGVGGIARIEVMPEGGWDVEYSGCTDVIWDTETSANDGPDLPRAGKHDGCVFQSTHRHPYPAYDQFMTAGGSIVLRKDVRLERWDDASAGWVAFREA
jgi:hypothetical protein